MKAKIEAEKQARRILNHYCSIANKLENKADNLALKDRPKKVQSRLNQMNKIKQLENKAEIIKKRGLKAWAYYINNYNDLKY